MRKVYLDHNATTPVLPEVRAALEPVLGEDFGNPSSSHWAGRAVKRHIDEARLNVARLVGAGPSEIFFTSGGTEGDNMALMGVMAKAGPGAHMVVSAVEHPAVFTMARRMEAMGYQVSVAGVDSDGIVSAEAVAAAMRPNTALVSVMLANNETGAINPIAEITAEAHRRGALVHTDAVQGAGKIPIDVKALGVDILTGSGHKFNALKGVGFQYIKSGTEISPTVAGGHQEHGMRSGTENVPGIVSLGAAALEAMRTMQSRTAEIGRLREMLERGILDGIPGSMVNGPAPEKRVYNTLNVTIKGVEAEAILFMLDGVGIAISTGSACASGSAEPSRILTSMGLDALCSRGALRMSLGHGNTEEDVRYTLDTLLPVANRLLDMSPFRGA